MLFSTAYNRTTRYNVVENLSIVVNNIVLGYPPDSDFLEHSKYVQYLVNQNESSAFSSLSRLLSLASSISLTVQTFLLILMKNNRAVLQNT